MDFESWGAEHKQGRGKADVKDEKQQVFSFNLKDKDQFVSSSITKVVGQCNAAAAERERDVALTKKPTSADDDELEGVENCTIVQDDDFAQLNRIAAGRAKRVRQAEEEVSAFAKEQAAKAGADAAFQKLLQHNAAKEKAAAQPKEKKPRLGVQLNVKSKAKSSPDGSETPEVAAQSETPEAKPATPGLAGLGGYGSDSDD
mmetsp:Transcript_41066/g.93737  ORF Transcript_41066/g.93737 Transcript_41066/m.93737 type:complete len:201 (+) Transcript_41066:52-654(+)